MIYLVIALVAALGIALFYVNKRTTERNVLRAEIKAIRHPTAWHNPDGPDYIKGPCVVVAKDGKPYAIHAPWMEVPFECEHPREVASLVNVGHQYMR